MQHETRESYLMAAVEFWKPIFKSAGYELPKVRVSTGWPSKSATAAKKRRIGECWAAEAADDGTIQIFISPWLGEVDAPRGVLPTLVHELVHAAVGLAAKHGGKFKKCALALGLEGKMTETLAGPRCLGDIKVAMEKLGPYPHGKLNPALSGQKKQTTRMIKAECETCGFTVRLTRKWLEDVGAPHCPKHGAMFYKVPDDLQDEDKD